MSENSLFDIKIRNEVTALAESLREVVVKFQALHNPLAESHDKVPKATKQLDKISEQTEAATQHMLDMIEAVTEREQDLTLGLKKILRINQNREEKLTTIVTSLIEKSEANCNDTFAIMDALQFQDITAQQMNHAASLLEEIESKLSQIVAVMKGETEEPSGNIRDQKKSKRVYDPHADMFEKKTDQQDIDNLFSNKVKK